MPRLHRPNGLRPPTYLFLLFSFSSPPFPPLLFFEIQFDCVGAREFEAEKKSMVAELDLNLSLRPEPNFFASRAWLFGMPL